MAPSGWVIGANQRINAEEAIKAYCVGGAYTTHEEDKKGRIVPGMFADLVVLDSDPTTVDVTKIKDVKVEMTMVAGKVVFE
jgi:predicted amidohydrolase YtcJ